MKLSELEAVVSDVSASASTQARTLSVAGLALVWLFAGPFFQREAGATRPPTLLLVAGAGLSLSLALDLAQLYLRTSFLNYTLHARERSAQEDLRQGVDPDAGDLGGAVWSVTTFLFFAKAVPLLATYALILIFFVRAALQR